MDRPQGRKKVATPSGGGHFSDTVAVHPFWRGPDLGGQRSSNLDLALSLRCSFVLSLFSVRSQFVLSSFSVC